MKPRTPVPQLLAIAVLVVTSVLGGCSNTASNGCIPPSLSLTPSATTAGTTVTLTADGAQCQAGSGRHYQVSISGNGERRGVGEVTPRSNGSFELTFAIPGDLPAANYEILVSGSALDDCTPDSRATCAQYSTVLTIQDTSTG